MPQVNILEIDMTEAVNRKRVLIIHSELQIRGCGELHYVRMQFNIIYIINIIINA